MSLLAVSSDKSNSFPNYASKSAQNKDPPKSKSVKILAQRFANSISSDGVCSACNGYYGQAHGQCVCQTCHAFLYANDLDLEVNVQLASVERNSDSDSDHDSGNDEPQDFLIRGAMAAIPDYEPGNSGSGNSHRENAESPIYKAFMGLESRIKQQRPPPVAASAFHHLQPIRVENLSEKLARLSLPRTEENNSVEENIVDELPPEVLMVIFSFLDDISLYAVGNVCRRWYQLLGKNSFLYFQVHCLATASNIGRLVV